MITKSDICIENIVFNRILSNVLKPNCLKEICIKNHNHITAVFKALKSRVSNEKRVKTVRTLTNSWIFTRKSKKIRALKVSMDNLASPL